MVQAQRRGPLALAAGGGGSQQGNLDPGFDVCVGVYQVEREEHPKAALKYFPIQCQKLCPQTRPSQ